VNIVFDNTYARQLAGLYTRTDPAPAVAPRLLLFNHGLAEELGLDSEALNSDQGAAIFSGAAIPDGAEPLAMAYAGHQFGQFVPQLGDGRALLLGEVVDRAGIRRDIQLKGSGPTPFSRRGDGRAALGPVLREYVISEAMHGLGIPTTRALAAVATGEAVYRETALPGAVFTRVARSHIRVGTFQFFAVRGDMAALKRLADYTIDRLYPELKDDGQPYLALLDRVMERQAALVAHWLSVGFIHGVMNTDNMAISGETIDFGPCAFMDSYHPETVFSSIDRTGRYAYGNQPPIAQWNLARFAETLLGLMDADRGRAIEVATARIVGFPDLLERHRLNWMRRKLGLFTEEDGDAALVQSWLDLLQGQQADFTLAFRGLAEVAAEPEMPGALFEGAPGHEDWQAAWRQRLSREPQTARQRVAAMRQVNPAFIPRNHRVEQALAAAVEHEDLGPLKRLMAVLARPYDDQPGAADLAEAPGPEARGYRTFCGT
jgi:serine/tyrosine/threonine adenylyltransferase